MSDCNPVDEKTGEQAGPAAEKAHPALEAAGSIAGDMGSAADDEIGSVVSPRGGVRLPDPGSLHILVDADACPVKTEIMVIAARHRMAVFLVSNQWLRIETGPDVHKIVVGDGFDAADDWIVGSASAASIVVSADILLADRCLKAGAAVIGPDGRPFTAANIASAVAMRELNSQLRAMGEISGFNRPYSPRQRSDFKVGLETLIQQRRRHLATNGR